jgi:hypothetical protein
LLGGEGYQIKENVDMPERNLLKPQPSGDTDTVALSLHLPEVRI